MSRKNKSYLAELKYQAVGDHLSGGGALREICKKYGIRDKHTLQYWIKLLSEECRPRSKGAAPSGSADLMQNIPRISKQFHPMQRIPTKTTTAHMGDFYYISAYSNFTEQAASKNVMTANK